MRSEVHSWRLPTDLKMRLQREASRRKTSLSAVLDMAAREWLSHTDSDAGEAAQAALHEAASKCLGAFAGRDARRSEKTRRAVRQRLRRRYGG
jgi:hypothetical protein